MYGPTLTEALTKGYGVERPFLCPVHGDSRPSASVNTIKQKWYCYTCGARGSLTGEAALFEPDYLQLKVWLMQKLEDQRVYPEAWLSRWDAGPVHPYWLARVGETAARAFRLGFDAETEEGTYPLRDPSGRVLGVVRRRLVRGDGPRYRYPRGVDVGRLLFNYTPATIRAVVLCEGAMDAIALWRVGVRALAIYGSRLSSDQVNLIDRVDPIHVITAYDNDDAGFSAHCDTKRAFRHRLVSRLTWPASWGKDVDELGQERLSKLVQPVLELQGVDCIESQTCRSPSSKIQSSQRSSPGIYRPGKMQILRTSA